MCFLNKIEILILKKLNYICAITMSRSMSMSFLLPGATWRYPPSKDSVATSSDLHERERTVRICEEHNTYKVITPDGDSPYVPMLGVTFSGKNPVHQGIFGFPLTNSKLFVSDGYSHTTPSTPTTPDTLEVSEVFTCCPIENSNFIKRRKFAKSGTKSD
jgi:hypothetical protein